MNAGDLATFEKVWKGVPATPDTKQKLVEEHLVIGYLPIGIIPSYIIFLSAVSQAPTKPSVSGQANPMYETESLWCLGTTCFKMANRLHTMPIQTKEQKMIQNQNGAKRRPERVAVGQKGVGKGPARAGINKKASGFEDP